MRRWIVIVLVGLMAASVALVAAGAWPATVVEDWVGTSLRGRIVGTFAILGGIALGLLVPAAVVASVVRRARSGRTTATERVSSR